VVYGKSDVLKDTPPWQGGGNMIADVTFEKTVYQGVPECFEAGTGNIADAVGLGAAIDYIERIGMANIGRYEHDLLVYGTAVLKKIPGLRLIGTAREKASVLSFCIGRQQKPKKLEPRSMRNESRCEAVTIALNRSCGGSDWKARSDHPLHSITHAKKSRLWLRRSGI